MEIHYSGKLTAKDWGRILALHNKQSLWGMLWRLMALTGVGLGAASWFWVGDPQPFPLAILLAVFLALSYPFWIHLTAPYGFSKNKAFLDELSGTISENGLAVRTSNSKSELSWSLFKTMKTSAELILLYQNPNAFHYFPKTFFRSDADWNSFRQLAEAKTGVKFAGASSR